MSRERAALTGFVSGLIAVVIVAVPVVAGCAAVTVKGQTVPVHVMPARSAYFTVPGDVAVFHYYGSGGWGVLWRDQYLLFAPYFSNHSLAKLLTNVDLRPDSDAIRSGVANTPIEKTRLVLIGHGHVDHAGDVGGLLDTGVLPKGQAGLVADRTTVNILAAYGSSFSCVKALEMADQGRPVPSCVPSAFRVTPLHSAHAPHLHVLGTDFEMFGGIVRRPRSDPPRNGGDFHLGYPWAFVVDLMGQDGKVAFRIHYMDAAAEPPHGVLPGAPPAGRDVDLAISCVPGFNYVGEYPDEVLRWGNVRYVMAAHWEDFFQSRRSQLRPVRTILDNHKLDQFVDKVERFLGHGPRGVVPLSGAGCKSPGCGPRGPNWALPVPGETFQFRTGAQTTLPRIPDPR
jgi:hypothetical protein